MVSIWFYRANLIFCSTPRLDRHPLGELTTEMEDSFVSLLNSSENCRSLAVYHPIAIRQNLSFPDKMLVQYDCGKLQVLAKMLAKLKREGN